MNKMEREQTGQLLQWSRHARQRQQQRGFQELDAILLQAFGEVVEDGYLMNGQALNEARQLLKTMIQRLDHISGSVLIEETGHVITTFRADKKRIRRLQHGHVKRAS